MILTALTLAWISFIVVFVCYPITTLFASIGVGIIAVLLFWYWMHTWTIHAWIQDRVAFWRLLWRKMTGREDLNDLTD